MSLDKNDVEKIAHLARIAIAEEDVPGYAESLSSILNLVEQMDAVNTNDVIPMAHPHAAYQRLREDAVTEENQREHFQKVTSHVEDGLYLVPKVLD
jgi:aspartyl-tRNA(Asn)/glutamyl-tRNA(Gln) amidotransferase subunit C